MNDVGLDSAAVEECATKLDGAAERLTNAIGALETTVAGLGQPWGTGPVGTAIGGVYTAVHDLAMGCYESNTEVIGDFVAALDGTVVIIDEARRKMESDVKKLAAAVAELYDGTPQPQ